MPEPTAPVQTASAPAAPKSASDYLNRSDDDIAVALQLPAKVVEVTKQLKAEVAKDAAEVLGEESEEAIIEAPTATDALTAALDKVKGESPKPDAKVGDAAPKPKPLTEFAVKDAEGVLDPPLELRFSFKANDKQYDDVPLDKLVKMAQMGYYNEDREQHVLGAKQFVAEAQQQIAERDKKLADIDAQVDRFMRDETFRAKAIELYQQQNSPEARAERAEQQVVQMRSQESQRAEAQKIVTFVQTDLAPRFTRLLESHPTISEQELVGHYTMLTAPLLVNGRVPPHKFSEVVRLLDTDVRHWVEAKHEERAAQHKVAEQAKADATLDLAKAKRTVARRTAPPTSSAPAQAPKRKFSSASEWLNATLPTQSDD